MAHWGSRKGELEQISARKRYKEWEECAAKGGNEVTVR